MANGRGIMELYRQNTWANLALIDRCRDLSDEQLGARIEGTYGAIRDTLLHLVAAQERYAAILAGREEGGALREDDGWPGWEVVGQHAESSSRELERLAAELPADRQVRRMRRDRTYLMPASVLLVQAINHGTEHREQVKATLTRLGIEPPAIDGWAYAREAGQIEKERS